VSPVRRATFPRVLTNLAPGVPAHWFLAVAML
jgi:hypothetical protein